MNKDYYNLNRDTKTDRNLQKDVGRTKDGEPINRKDWIKTLEYIDAKIDLGRRDDVLELCCGNGLILGEVAKYCNSATGVDYSKALIKQFKENYEDENLRLILEDVKKTNFKNNVFTKCIFYFSIQYFNYKEAVELIEKCSKWIKPGGVLFIGDVPNLEKKWDFYNQPDYQKDYFERLKNDKSNIGTWYQKEFFLAMPSYLQNIRVSILDQPAYQINSEYRFDVLISIL